jgi:hypothetical protein
MKRFPLSLRLEALAFAVGLAAAAVGRADPPSPTSSQHVIALLQEDIDLKDLADNKLKLKDMLEVISTHLKERNKGKEVLILVDVNAFKRENPDVAIDGLLGEEVEIPAFPKKMTVARLLRLALDKLPSCNATYVVRRGGLEVTTCSQASPVGQPSRKLPIGGLEQTVVAAFSGVPLKQAVEELADQVGVSVVLDPRAAEKLKMPVTATFRNDTTLGAALDMLADMCELKLVVLEGRPRRDWQEGLGDQNVGELKPVQAEGLFLTTPANAEALQKEQARRRAAAVPRVPARSAKPKAQPQAP